MELHTVKRIFEQYKLLAEKAIAQMDDEDLKWKANEDSNSVVNIMKHMWGNMLSRWTDFLTTDGEKTWRKRDEEFEDENMTTADQMQRWEEGWRCVFAAIGELTEADLVKTVYIRNEPHTVSDAIMRQIAHYAYHVGQIVYIAKERSRKEWNSLSIPRNKSAAFNESKFSGGKLPG